MLKWWKWANKVDSTRRNREFYENFNRNFVLKNANGKWIHASRCLDSIPTIFHWNYSRESVSIDSTKCHSYFISRLGVCASNCKCKSIECFVIQINYLFITSRCKAILPPPKLITLALQIRRKQSINCIWLYSIDDSWEFIGISIQMKNSTNSQSKRAF